MNKDSDGDVAKILYRLMRLGKWEHAHTSIDNLIKGFPKHKRGEVRKLILKLIRQGFLHVKPTAYGREVSLNIQKKREIEELVFRHLKQA